MLSSHHCGWTNSIGSDFLSDLFVFTSAVFEFYIGNFYHFFLHRCRRKTASSSDHCFNVSDPRFISLVDPVSHGLPPLRLRKDLFSRSYKSFRIRRCRGPHPFFLHRCVCRRTNLFELLALSFSVQALVLQTVVCFTVPPLWMKEALTLLMHSHFFLPLWIDLPFAAPPLQLSFH